MNYAAIATRVVAPALKKYGVAMTYRTYADVYDEDTGITARTATDTSVHGIIASYKSRDIDGEQVQTGDRRIAATGIPAPTRGDQVIVGSTTYTVVGFSVVGPDGTAIACELQVRP